MRVAGSRVPDQAIATVTAPTDSQANVSVAFGPGGTLAVGAANSDVYLWHVKS
jgi:hypothetical protein